MTNKDKFHKNTYNHYHWIILPFFIYSVLFFVFNLFIICACCLAKGSGFDTQGIFYLYMFFEIIDLIIVAKYGLSIEY